MIRDPSDGSIREKLPDGYWVEIEHGSVLGTGTSGLPITKAKESYLAQLEESRKWLKAYVRPTIHG